MVPPPAEVEAAVGFVARAEHLRPPARVVRVLAVKVRAQPLEALLREAHLHDLVVREAPLDGAAEPRDVEDARRGPQGGAQGEARPGLRGRVESALAPAHLDGLLRRQLEGLGPGLRSHVGDAHGDARVPAVGDEVDGDRPSTRCRALSPRLAGLRRERKEQEQACEGARRTGRRRLGRSCRTRGSGEGAQEGRSGSSGRRGRGPASPLGRHPQRHPPGRHAAQDGLPQRGQSGGHDPHSTWSASQR